MTVTITQNEAVKAFGKLAKQLSKIQLLQLSEGAKTNLEKFRYLNQLEGLQWPLYFVFDKALMQDLASFASITEDNEDEIRDIIYNFCTSELVKGLLEEWERSSVINQGRIPILKEAITLYTCELYYGAVSTFVCQLNGIITDTYEMQRRYGKDFDLEDIKVVYKKFNPEKKIPSKITKNSERTQLLWFASDVKGGIVYWIKAIEYIYNIVLTSENFMSQSNQPCRNKICHGIQLNFGTKEHALKSILAIDMMIRLAENLKLLNEETIEM